MAIISVIKNKLLGGNERSANVKKNIFGSLAIKGISVLVSLAIVPLTIGYLSSDLYGIWLTLSSLVHWLNFFDVGFTLGLKNRLNEAIAVGDWGKGKSLVSTTYFMMVLIFVPLGFVVSFFVPNVDWASFLNVSDEYQDDITATILVLVFCFSFQMVVNVLTAVVAAHQKTALSSSFHVISQILSLIVIIILTKYAKPSLYILSYSVAAIPIFVIIVSSVLLYRTRFRSVAPSIMTIDKHRVKDLFQLGYKFFIIQLEVVVLFQTTNVLISNFAGPSEVTVYNVAYKYFSISLMLFGIIMGPIWPAFTDAYTKRDYVWMQDIYRKMKQFYRLVCVAICCMVIVSPIVYNIWIGDKVDIPYTISLLLGVYMLINTWGSIHVNSINGIGTVKLQTIVALFSMIIHIPLSILLGSYIGYMGVISSMLIITAIHAVIYTIQLRKLVYNNASGIWGK